jgi:hypothetical protein
MGTIPEGIYKCRICGDYKGIAKYSDFNWKGSMFEDMGYGKKEEEFILPCFCESTLLCSKCKKNKIYRSMSMEYNEKDNSIWFRPCFASLVPCKECRTKGGTITDSCPAQR